MTDFFQHGVFATHDDEYLVEPFWAEENETTLDRQDFHIVYRRSAILRTSSHCGLTGQSLTHCHSLTRGHYVPWLLYYLWSLSDPWLPSDL